MWFILGIVRSTALYMAIVALLSSQEFLDMVIFYVVLLAIHVLIWKVKDHQDPGDMAIHAFMHDLIAPFLGIKALIELLLNKYLTDKSEPHAALFASQGILEAIWSILLLIFVVNSIR